MIQYTVAKRRNPADPENPKFYPKIVRAATLETDEIAALLQSRTTLEKSEVYSFLKAFAGAVQFLITHSYTVEVEGLGIFTPAIKAKAVNTPDELTAKTITHKGVNYRPTAKMTTRHKSIGFEKANLESAHL